MYTLRANIRGQHYTLPASPDQTLLDALRAASPDLAALYEQLGTECMACIRIDDGLVPPPTERERRALDVGLLDCGVRLAAETFPRGDMTITVPL